MPILGQLLVSIFGGLSALLTGIFGAKVAIRVAAFSAFLGFGAALLLVFNTVVSPLVGGMFSTSYGQLLGLAFPPISGTCVAAIASVWSACALYGVQRRALGLVVV
jgi:hypothetical protein